MGQKTNPIALRLTSSTKIFDNSWYNDYSYSNLINSDFFLAKYINTFLKFVKLPSARLSICRFHNTIKIYTFFCYPRQSRDLNSRIFQVSQSLNSLKSLKLNRNSNKLQNQNSRQFLTDYILWNQFYSYSKKKVIPYLLKDISLENSKFLPIYTNFNIYRLKKNHISSDISNFSINSKNVKNLSKSLIILNFLKENSKLTLNKYSNDDIKILFNIFTFFLQKKEFNKLILNTKNYQISKNRLLFNSFLNLLDYYNKEKLDNYQINLKYKNYLENFLSNQFNLNVQVLPFKILNEWQSANFFADEIVYLLERRVPFRRLKSMILKLITQNHKIRGIRITCSGRVGGKSKKAQRAKIESIKFGQTSLHVFSSKIDFACKTAYTSLGSTGVKIWICYN